MAGHFHFLTTKTKRRGVSHGRINDNDGGGGLNYGNEGKHLVSPEYENAGIIIHWGR